MFDELIDRLTHPRLTPPDVPTETDEYRREEQGTWAHELKWQRRAIAHDPAWYFNRLVALCAFWWLLTLVPGALVALESAASILSFSLAVAVRWMHELQALAFSAQLPKGTWSVCY